MTDQSVENDTLETLAEKIVEHATAACSHALEAARLTREARERVEAGEAGDVSWSEWARENINLSESRVRDLLRIAEAEDPKAELERQRAQNRARQATYRKGRPKGATLRNVGATAGRPAGIEAERKQLIEWAGSAPFDHVMQVLSYIGRLEAEAAVADPAPVAVAAAAE